ncbi:MAG: metalloregulator ArsR/SmtB family transcription factor [Bacteroidota bacterium]|nr:metalloregulator ArsR/SmtB family transcription factor [Bacteroidota bacterium]MDP4232088.1 metalloregulator ArsR/SmtB family transcription factor [Bacteroidota bacterium]MDP4241205.1 metalloregulator ArsR/SmtB family transcription factor [Bacteroidota bacterium]MDP4286597.1 metalloregulator ArsR/SmtB family transcription factor [Bacteroidota bacterium]
MRRDVFQAIADPTRRAILALLAVQTLTVSGIAEHFNVTRPAVSKHLKILAECGLVSVTQHGRERYCEAKLKKLDEVSNWVERYREMWEQRLDRLEIYLAELQANDKSNGNTI